MHGATKAPCIRNVLRGGLLVRALHGRMSPLGVKSSRTAMSAMSPFIP
jgi:hypothetical protein